MLNDEPVILPRKLNFEQVVEQPDEAKDVSEIGEALIQLDLKVDKKCPGKVTRTNSKVFPATVTKVEA